MKWRTTRLRLLAWQLRVVGRRWGPGLCNFDRVELGRNPEVGVPGQDLASYRTSVTVAVLLGWAVGLVGQTTLPFALLLSSFEVCLLQQNRPADPLTEGGGRDFRKPRLAFQLALWEGSGPNYHTIV